MGLSYPYTKDIVIIHTASWVGGHTSKLSLPLLLEKSYCIGSLLQSHVTRPVSAPRERVWPCETSFEGGHTIERRQ